MTFPFISWFSGYALVVLRDFGFVCGRLRSWYVEQRLRAVGDGMIGLFIVGRLMGKGVGGESYPELCQHSRREGSRAACANSRQADRKQLTSLLTFVSLVLMLAVAYLVARLVVGPPIYKCKRSSLKLCQTLRTFIQGIPKAERMISAILPSLLLKLLGSGPLESVSPFPAADSVRFLWIESGIGLPIYTLSNKPMPFIPCIDQERSQSRDSGT